MRLLLVLLSLGVAASAISCASRGPGDPRTSGAPADLRWLLNQGRANMMELRYERAAELYLEASRRYPTRSACFRLYGRALFALGRFRESSAAFQRGIELYPRSADVPHDLRRRYEDPARFDARLAELETRVREESEDTDLLFLLAYFYHLLGRSSEAAPLFHRLSEAGSAMTSYFASAPPSPRATPYRELFFRGRKSFSEGRYEDAVAWFNEATRLYPQRSSANHLHARALLAVGRFHEASERFQKAIEIKPLAAHRPRDLRQLFPRVEDFDARVSELEAKTRESGEETDLVFLLGYLYHVSGRSEEATRVFRRLAGADFALASLFLEPVTETMP